MINREEIYQSLYLAGCVKRYHTWPVIHPQTVGQHCWRVACIYVEVFGLPRAEVLYYCLHHDSGELYAGDVPFNTKSKTEGLKKAMCLAEEIGLQKLGIYLPELTKRELIRIKISDLLEMHEKGEVEFTMGNLYAECVMNDTLEMALQISEQFDETMYVKHWLEDSNVGV